MYPTSRSDWIVAAGDLCLIIVVIVAGQLSHGVSPISAPLDSIETLLPFLFGWVLLVALLDLYRGPRVSDLATGVRTLIAAWLGAAGVGLVIRSSPYFDGGAAWPFGLVIIGTVLVVLVPWRVVAIRFVGDDTEDTTAASRV